MIAVAVCGVINGLLLLIYLGRCKEWKSRLARAEYDRARYRDKRASAMCGTAETMTTENLLDIIEGWRPAGITVHDVLVDMVRVYGRGGWR